MKKIFLIILIGITIVPAFSKAQEYTLLEPLPCIEGVTKDISTKCKDGLQKKIDLDGYILYIYKFAIALAVFLAIVMIIWGGFLYITSETPFKIADGKAKIVGAMQGLAMVLVSYLILLTIDPRLVNIDSNIPAIKYNELDLEAIRKFQEQLTNDMRNLSIHNQEKVRSYNDRIEVLKEQQNELDKKYQLHEIDDEEYGVESAKIKNETALTDTNKNKVVAQDIGLVNFRRALEILGNLENYTENSSVHDKKTGNVVIVNDTKLSDDLNDNLKEASNTIKLKYAEYIQKIGNSDSEAINLLKKQEEFFLSEIESQKDIVSSCLWYKNSDRLKDIMRPYLNTKLEEANQELENPQKGESLGLGNEYKTLIQQRIVLIEGVLSEN